MRFIILGIYYKGWTYTHYINITIFLDCHSGINYCIYYHLQGLHRLHASEAVSVLNVLFEKSERKIGKYKN